jgi:indolepyruvate ferredoxin oxidoreductase
MSALRSVSLDDKYALPEGRVYLTGVQALVRLPLLQRQRDRAAGLDTACFISGYRGSPLGGFDKALWQAQLFLEPENIRFQPGINEDLAATALWGSQQVGLFEDALHDGVFGIWYGKGPGVDRSGDALKHANAAGTARYGGVLALAGDDHACKSSTLPHQSEYAFMDASIPVLNPANIQEILDYGLHGWAMSRYSGCWIAMKTIAETVDSSASVLISADRALPIIPSDFELPPDGLNIRWPDPPLAQELRLHKYKLYAALAFARANKLDRIIIDSKRPRLGIITTGKSYLDVRQALDDLGIDAAQASEIGLRLYKVAMSWPLEREGVRHFAEGLEEILVVEEKRAIIENQMKEQLYNWREDVRPRVIGKFDEARNWILPSNDELTPARIARVIASRIARFHRSARIEDRLAFLEAKERQLEENQAAMIRVPTFCSGCPHNISTRVPEGSRALAGIGCHYMAIWMDRSTETFTQMGGEGASWIGQAPFTKTKHVFVNMGDGTFFHSGLLAIRAAVASGANATYKILFNDAVAMTGGQPVEGGLTVSDVISQLAAEGVAPITVVSDRPEQYALGAFPYRIAIAHRDELDRIQRDMREQIGISAIVYDQTCAAEKRRRRKRGLIEDPKQRVVINELVCEGCGDCGEQSNCVSIVPVETEYGRKRAIDQSSCNKDYSCRKGFCPSFVTVTGGALRLPTKTAQEDSGFAELPLPPIAPLDHPYGILVTGVGGTGVVTIGALLGMAAHLEGKGCSVLDMTGLAQKNGAVFSHVRIAASEDLIHSVRIPAGEADLVIGADLVTTGSYDALAKMRVGVTRAVINSHEFMTSGFTHDPDLPFAGEELRRAVEKAIGAPAATFLDATGIATALLGDAIGANLFLLGYAAQQGLLPVSIAAIERAIELNDVAVSFNKQAFRWGRRAAHDLASVLLAASPNPRDVPEHRRLSQSLDELVARRVRTLTAYQDRAYGERYANLVARVRAAEQARVGGEALTRAVGKNYFKLLAYKDEYEVARLYSDGTFARQVAAQFTGDFRLEVHLASPLLARHDAEGHPVKRAYGPWMLRAFRLLARLKFLRGTALDPFGRSAERREERRLITEYEALVAEIIAGLTPANQDAALELASLPEKIRGYGHIKARNIAAARQCEAELRGRFRDPAPAKPVEKATAAE